VERAWEHEARESGTDVDGLARKMRESTTVLKPPDSGIKERMAPEKPVIRVQGEERKETDERDDKRLSRMSMLSDEFVDAPTSPVSEKPKDWNAHLQLSH
jgi:hypothetical protein